MVAGLIASLAFVLYMYFFSSKDWSGAYQYVYTYGQTKTREADTVTGKLVVEPDSSKKARYSFTYKVASKHSNYTLKGHALKKGSSLVFYLDKLIEGHYSELATIEPTEPLLMLKHESNNLATQWLQPTAQKSLPPYFQKLKTNFLRSI